MKLYELSTEMLKWVATYNEAETDDQLLLVEQQLNDLQIAFDQKAIGVAKYVLGLESDVESVNAEIKRLQATKSRIERSSEWMRGYLKKNMDATNTTEIDGKVLKLKIKKNPPRVEIEDEEKIPSDYKTSKVIVCVNKDAIKQAQKAGVGVAGTRMVQETRLEIK